MLEAKSNLSRLVEELETGKEREIIIARNGRPAAKLIPVHVLGAGNRIGIAAGFFEVPDDIDICNDEIRNLFDIP